MIGNVPQSQRQLTSTLKQACAAASHACITPKGWPGAAQAKRKRQHMGSLKLVVAGCVAAQEGAALLRRVPELDLVMGPHHAHRCALQPPVTRVWGCAGPTRQADVP